MRFLSAALVLVLAACGGGGGQSPASATPLATYTVARGDLEVAVEEGGSLRSAKPVAIMIKEPGKILQVVAEGTRVKSGDLLLELESKDLAGQLESQRLDLELAQRSIEGDEAAIRLFELESAKTLSDAERTLRFARLALTQYRDGKAPLTRQDHEIGLRRATVEQADAEEKATRMPELLDKGFVNPVEVRQAALEAEAKQQAARKAKRTLEVFDQFEQPQELAKLEADAAGAEINLERTRQQVATQRRGKEGELKRTQDKVARLTRSVAALVERIGNLRITAPADGIVVYGDPRRGYWNQPDPLDVGRDLHPGQAVMSLPDLSTMVAEAAVSEANIARIAEGLPATVTVEGLGGRSFHGSVKKIATTANQEWMAETKRYLATISLDDANGAAFRPDMSCRVRIRIALLPQVVQVPVDAVSVRDGKAWCWVRTATGRQRRAVELGQSSATRVEIRQGLAEGEVVEVLPVEPAD
jgi:multidrug resistance efflux pump